MLQKLFGTTAKRDCEKTVFSAGCGPKARNAKPDHSDLEKPVVQDKKCKNFVKIWIKIGEKIGL